MGALHPRKNVKRLLEAYSIFKKTFDSDYEIVIVGESLWKNSSFKIDLPESLKNHIHFTGHLPIDELALLMGAAAVFTYVPYFEGFGIPLVEAMRCGTPILAGNLTSLPEVAYNAAYYCDPFDVKDISKKMVEIVSNIELRDNLSKNVLRRSLEFSWDKAAEIVWKEIAKFNV